MAVSYPLYVSPIGGCGEFGKNLTLYRYRDSLYVVDCGIRFAEMWQLGITSWIPDHQQLFSTYGAPTAYLLTHGHEDHIGAIPMFYSRWPAPIYGSAWTIELIKIKFDKFNLEFKQPPIVVKAGETTELNDGFAVDWLAVNHSIPMTCALLLRTPQHRVFHSGDFKFDPTPPYEEETDFQALQKLRPIDLLLVDSTNVHLPGPSPSERSVRPTLQSYLARDCSAIYLTTFASNVWRIKQVVEIAQLLNKPIFAISRAIENSIIIGMKLGVFDPDNSPITFLAKSHKPLPDGSIVLVSGCQGERMSSLARLVQGRLMKCKLTKNDLVIFSSRPIPGNELEIIKICERIKEVGAQVVTTSEDPNIHVSGHAHSEDIAKLIECLAPREIMPVHGNYSHLDEVRRITDGIRSHVPSNGDLYELGNDGLQKISSHQFGSLFIDSDSLIQLSFKTMKERMRLSELGLCLVVGVISKLDRKWIAQPQVQQLLGLCEAEQQESLCKRINKVLANEIAATDIRKLDQGKLNEKVRNMFRRRLNGLIGKRAVVTCNIIEV